VPQRHDQKFRKAREQAEAEVARQQVEVARQCEQEEEAREQAEAEAARQHEEVARQAREQEEAEAARQQEEVARQQAVVARQQVEVTAARQQARQVELVLKTAMNPGDWFLNRAGRLPRLRGAVADAGRSGLPSIQQLLSRAKVVLSLEEGEGASSGHSAGGAALGGGAAAGEEADLSLKRKSDTWQDYACPMLRVLRTGSLAKPLARHQSTQRCTYLQNAGIFPWTCRASGKRVLQGWMARRNMWRCLSLPLQARTLIGARSWVPPALSAPTGVLVHRCSVLLQLFEVASRSPVSP
jgi:flagellar biosynthesis GTPase FlhF